MIVDMPLTEEPSARLKPHMLLLDVSKARIALLLLGNSACVVSQHYV